MNYRAFLKIVKFGKHLFRRRDLDSDDDIDSDFSDEDSFDDSDSSRNSLDVDLDIFSNEISLEDAFNKLITISENRTSKEIKITYFDINYLKDLNETRAAEYCRVLYEFCCLMQSKNQLEEVVRIIIQIDFFNVYGNSLKIYFEELLKTKNDDLFATLCLLIDIVIKLSNESIRFCKFFTEAGLNEIHMSLLADKYFSKDIISSDDNMMDLCFRLLSVIYNVVHVNNVPEARFNLSKLNAGQICQQYRGAKSLLVSFIARILWIYLRSEKECDVYTDSKVCKLVLQILRTSLESDSFEGSYFTPEESLDSVKIIAKMDINKSQLIKEGVLEYYTKILQNYYKVSDRVMVMAAEGLYSFSFKFSNEIRAYPDTIKALKKAALDSNVDVRDKAMEALVTLENNDPSTKLKAQNFQKMVFISYQHESTSIILKIRDSLETTGFKTWLDVNKMNSIGSTVEAMAKGIEQASFVLICFSKKYQQSRNCKKEAEYAFKLSKETIPLRMESEYKPDGWLGFIVGSDLIYDFSKDNKYVASMEGLIAKLHSYNEESSIERPQGASKH